MSVRLYPGGVERRQVLRSRYRRLVRAAMPVARERGDRSTYSDLKVRREGRLRVRVTRHSELKRYDSPYVLVVGPDPSARWLIHEELSFTEP